MRTFYDKERDKYFEVENEDIFKAIPEDCLVGTKWSDTVESNEYSTYPGPYKCWLVEDEKVLDELAEAEEYFQYWNGSNWCAVCIRSLDGVGDVEEVQVYHDNINYCGWDNVVGDNEDDFYSAYYNIEEDILHIIYRDGADELLHDFENGKEFKGYTKKKFLKEYFDIEEA